MARFYTLILSMFLLMPVFPAEIAEAQSARYEVLPSPDLSYNDVDGIRVGMRLKGQVPGTFEDGPHRLDAGIWLGLWFPKTPVSYYVSLTEPVSIWSDYGSEAAFQFISSIRTGYHDHGIGFSKRWQQGFDERRYREVGVYNSFEKRFDHEYAAFPSLWSEKEKLLTVLRFNVQNDSRLGWYNININGNMQYLNDFFSVWTLTATQHVNFHEHWGLRIRYFAGAASKYTAPEYLFSRSYRPAIDWMGNGFTRAKGTIPQPWMESGNIHVAGGANLRGYASQDIKSFHEKFPEQDSQISIPENDVIVPALFRSFTSLNTELDYWNPITVLLNDVSYLSEFLNFRSYLFFDAGTSLGFSGDNNDNIYSNAGAGFSLAFNIPDYQGKPRGFVLRYEIPFWLSEPGEDDSFKLRHLAGFGAVISF